MLRLLTCIFLLINGSFSHAQFTGINHRTVIVPSASDNFPGTTLSANWTVPFGAFAINGSGGVFGNTTGESLAAYTGATFANNQQSCVVLQVSNTDNFVGPAARVSSTAETAYLVNMGNNGTSTAVNIQSVIAGSFTTLTAQVNATVGDTYCLNAVGSTISLTDNGTQVLTATDSSITSGSPGLTAFGGLGVGTLTHVGSWKGKNL